MRRLTLVANNCFPFSAFLIIVYVYRLPFAKVTVVICHVRIYEFSRTPGYFLRDGLQTVTNPLCSSSFVLIQARNKGKRLCG